MLQGSCPLERFSMYELSDFYQKKLLEPGWAGELSPEELEHIKKKLKPDKRLRAKWGFGKGKRRLSESKIRLVAQFGVEGL